jgi:hypothetical protein
MTILVVLLLALVGAGCGGGDDEAASDDTVVTETTTDETTDETTTDTDEDTGTAPDLGTFLSGDCQELVAAYAALSQAFAAASGGGDDFTEESQAFQAFADEAPDEIRGDIEVLAEAYAEYAGIISDLGIQPGEIPDADDLEALSTAAASFNSAEVTAASERLTAWTTENCSG